MTRVDRSNTNLNEQLQWQLDFLHTSLKRYEAGHEHEAIRVAVILRIMCHDHGKNSRSLLGQLSHKTIWTWLDTSRVGSHPPMQWGFLQIEHPIGYEPRFGAPVNHFDPASEKWVDFDDWWTIPLIRDNDQNTFSRKDLVMFVADQDGGAHVDPTLEEKYNALSRLTSLGYHGRTSRVDRRLSPAEWCTTATP